MLRFAQHDEWGGHHDIADAQHDEWEGITTSLTLSMTNGGHHDIADAQHDEWGAPEPFPPSP